MLDVGRLGGVAPRQVRADDRGPVRGQGLREGGPDAGRAARDECDLSVQVPIDLSFLIQARRSCAQE